MLNTINTEKPLCLDIETKGLDRHRHDITSIQLGYTSNEDGKFTRKFFDWNKLGKKRQIKLMKKLKECKLVTHNGKFDLLFLYEKTGISLNLWVDTLVLAHICGEEDLTLKGLTRKYFHVDYDISKQSKIGIITEELKSYALDDVLYPMKLMKIFRKKVEKEDLLKVFKHEMRAYKAYYEIEKGGVPISLKRHEVLEKLQNDLRPFKEKLLFYGDINWNSNEQVASILFTKKDEPVYREDGERLDDTFKVNEKTVDGNTIELGEFSTRKEANLFKKQYLEDNPYTYKLTVNLQKHFKPTVIGYGQGLKVLERTDKGAPSVGIDTLSKYVGNDCVDTLLEYKRISKLITFIESWEKLQVNDRIYPSFNITARTGRTTCKNPNLQQCPQDSYVRNLIEARPGWKLVECFSGDTEVLTEQGWKRLDNLDKSLKVAQYDIDTKEITFTKPLGYIHKKDRETFLYEDRHTSLCATANHNMLTTFGAGKPTFKRKYKDVRYSRGNAFINAGHYNNGASNELQSRYIAMFTADGSMSPEGYVKFCFSKTRKVERCKNILDSLGVEYSLNEQLRKSGVINYVFYVGKRANHLLDGYVGRDKRLTINCVHSLDIKAFLDEVQYWDATYTIASNKQSVRFVSTVRETIEIIQMMCVLQGKKSTIRYDLYNYNSTNGRQSVSYYLNYKKDRVDEHTFMNGKTPDWSNPIIQDVYCVNMPLGTLVIRHNGKVSIQGNCDFSQIELRVASWFSGDANMQHAYNSGSDLHSKTTELLFGDTSSLSPEEQKRKRTQSKSMNFGFLYGMMAKTFIDYAIGYGLNLTQEESEKLRENFFNAYPTLISWHEECKDYAKTYGYIKSPIGRKRWFPNIHSSNFALRSADERQSINSGVQGFASDLCISAIADIVFSKELDHSRFNVLGSVHDAILFEIKDDYVDELVPVLKEMMENPSILEGLEKPIPIIADVEVSQCWGGH